MQNKNKVGGVSPAGTPQLGSRFVLFSFRNVGFLWFIILCCFACHLSRSPRLAHKAWSIHLRMLTKKNGSPSLILLDAKMSADIKGLNVSQHFEANQTANAHHKHRPHGKHEQLRTNLLIMK